MILLCSFLMTFLIVRIVTHAIRDGRWPRVFHNFQTPGGTHFHHLVIGIILILISGYVGLGLSAGDPRRLVVAVFGVGAALTLDEFALWLHLKDDY